MKRRGIAMVEAVLAAAMVGGLAVAALSLVSSTATERRIAAERTMGQLLASQLAEEIASLPIRSGAAAADATVQTLLQDALDVTTKLLAEERPLPTRTTYDDVIDYNGLTESPPRLRDGTAVPGADGWTRATEVTQVAGSALEGGEVAGTGVLRVRVVASINGREAGYAEFFRTAAGDEALP